MRVRNPWRFYHSYLRVYSQCMCVDGECLGVCVCVCDVCSVEFWGLEKERTHLFHVHLCVCVCSCGISVARLRLFLSVNLNVNVEPIVRDSGSHAQFPMHTAHKVCALSHYVLYLNSNWTSSLDQMFGVGFKIMKFNLFFSRWKVTLWASFWCGPFQHSEQTLR